MKYIMKQFLNRGFTMIEIIISLSLIGLFIALPVLAYSSYIKKSRDIKRKNDINQMATALQQYKMSVGTYPTAASGNIGTNLQILVSRGYIPAVPKDPKDGQPAICTQATKYCYSYTVSADLLTYTLSARLEDATAAGAGSANSYFQATPAGTGVVATSAGSSAPTTAPVASNTPLPTNSVIPTTTATLTKTPTPSRTLTPTPTTIPPSTWSRTFGGTLSDGLVTMRLTADGGYLMSGYTNNYGGGGTDVFLAKLNISTSALNWKKAIGGSANDRASAMEITSDGGSIVTGATSSYGAGGADFLVQKIDSSGTITWARTIGSSGNDNPFAVDQTADGGYVVAGNTTGFSLTTAGVYIVKFSSTGTVVWTKIISTSNDMNINALTETADGGIALAGYWGPGGNTDMYLLKTDSSGTILWQRAIGGTGNDSAFGIAEGQDGGIVIVGNSNLGAPNNIDIYLAKFDNSGNLLFRKTYGGTGTETGYDVTGTTDGGYMIAGIGPNAGGVPSAYFLKIDINGGYQWAKTYTASTTSTVFKSVRQMSDSSYIAGGEYIDASGYSHYYAVRTSSAGSITGCSDVASIVPTVGATGVTSIPVPTLASGGTTVIPTPGVATGGTLTLRCN